MVLTGYVIKIAVPAENIAEDVIGITGHGKPFTGAERIFTVYAKQSAGHDPLLTCPVNFLTDHA